ncbi:MAG: DUF971 domain-containing protein [Ignavibacteriaceae bacterium]|jgi:DUF971 family protein|nr:DUF971 domain-containing protein [Ignavibacteriaceae bacterium]
MKPKKIKLHKDESILEIIWDNDFVHRFPLKFLRDESPDAGNKGETIMWKHYPPPPKGPDKPGKYEIEKIDKVGNYGIQIKWKDGNDDGIYSWDLLVQMGDLIEVKNNLRKDLDSEH